VAPVKATFVTTCRICQNTASFKTPLLSKHRFFQNTTSFRTPLSASRFEDRAAASFCLMVDIEYDYSGHPITGRSTYSLRPILRFSLCWDYKTHK